MTIYFIQSGENGAIKIGFSSNIQSRISTIQNGNSEKIKVLGVMSGGRSAEQLLHAQFSKFRISGEWFTPAAEIKSFCKDNCQQILGVTDIGNVKNTSDVEIFTARLVRRLNTEISQIPIKDVSMRTGLSCEAVKKWRKGGYCPSGAAIVLLMANYDSIFSAILEFSGRNKPSHITSVQKQKIEECLRIIEGLS